MVRATPRAASARATVHQGKELSFTNLLDLDAAARIALEFDEPAAVVIKHTNPCGVATGGSLAEAYVRARDADPLSAFGGIVGLNRPIDVETARALAGTFIEAVVAPGRLTTPTRVLTILASASRTCASSRRASTGSTRGARAASILGRVARAGARSRDRGGDAVAAGDDAAGRDRRAPTAEEWEALRFAWRVCAHVKSNTVIFTAQRTPRWRWAPAR